MGCFVPDGGRAGRIGKGGISTLLNPCIPDIRWYSWIIRIYLDIRALKTPLALFPLSICLALAVWQMRYDWTYDETYYYGWIVLPLALYLFSLRWRDRPLPAAPASPRLLVLGWVLISLLIPLCWVIREAKPAWRPLGVAFGVISVSAALLTASAAGGRPWRRHFAGPIFFFLIAIPWPSILEKSCTSFLMPANAAVTLEVLHWVQIPAIRSGHLITLPGGTLGVEEACSGIRSLQSTFMMALFLGELNSLRGSARLLLFLAGAVFALCTNILRTIGLSIAAATQGLQAADLWHDRAGLLALAANVLWLYGLAAYLTRQNPRPQPQAPASMPSERHRPASGIWQPAGFPPFILLIFSIAAMFPLTAWWYGRNEGPPPPGWHLAAPTAQPGYRSLPMDDRTALQLLKPGGWTARWQTPSGQALHGFFLEWNPGQIAPDIMTTHLPGNCLSNLGMKLVKEYPPLQITLAGEPATARLLRFNDHDRPLFVLYLLRENNPSGSIASPAQGSRLAPVIEGRRNAGQRLVEIGLWDEPSEPAARALFTALLQTNLRSGSWQN